MEKRLRIALVVPGRFDAFDLAKALISQGHVVRIYTNYPRWAIRPFGISAHAIRSFWLHGVLSRVAWFLKEKIQISYPEATLNIMFGKWAAKNIVKEKWDIVHVWSGISEEVLPALKSSDSIKILMRGSAHIKTQSRLLNEEEARCRAKVEKPSPWIIAREEREYALADHIRVISYFAYSSFIAEGVAGEKLVLIPSGVSVTDFRPSHQIIKERVTRILQGEPLHVLYVGALSFQKGIRDLYDVVRSVDKEKFRFYLAGPKPAETRKFISKLRPLVKLLAKRNQQDLPELYSKADIFIFPTIQDGYAVVLAQAQASGLPIITTTNCAGPDIIMEGETGWVLPIRRPDFFIEKLLWCDSHRKELAEMVKYAYKNYRIRDWADVAKDFADVCVKIKEKKDEA